MPRIVITPEIDALLHLCAALGASQAEAGRAVGLDRTTVHAWRERTGTRFARKGNARGTWTLPQAIDLGRVSWRINATCAPQGRRAARDAALWHLTAAPEAARHDVPAALAKMEAA